MSKDDDLERELGEVVRESDPMPPEIEEAARKTYEFKDDDMSEALDKIQALPEVGEENSQEEEGQND